MTTDPGDRLFSAPNQPPPSTRRIHTKSMPLIVMNYSAIHGHTEYDEPTTCSLHQFLTRSSNLKAAAAGDCCVAIEFASKLMQNQPIFFVFTEYMMWSYIHGYTEYDEPTTCSLHQFLTRSSNLKAAAASDCCVAIEFASKLVQNEPIFFVFTAITMWSYFHGHMEYAEPITCSLHQFLTGSSNLKAAAAGDCCVAIEIASKLMQNEQIITMFSV